MDMTLTVNVWFLVSLCLACLVIGLLLGGRAGSRHHYWEMMDGPVSTETSVHVIEISEGCLKLVSRNIVSSSVLLHILEGYGGAASLPMNEKLKPLGFGSGLLEGFTIPNENRLS